MSTPSSGARNGLAHTGVIAAAAIAVLLVLLAAAFAYVRYGGAETDAAAADPPPAASADPWTLADTEEPDAPAEVPERVVIPRIDVDSDLVRLGFDEAGAMEVPTDFSLAGWFEEGPAPGEVGPAVIAGHVDDRTGPAVFAELGLLEPDDVVEVHSESGQSLRFAVTSVHTYAKDDFPTESVYGPVPGAELRLITCGGAFDRSIGHYEDNVVVFARALT